ncbi:MAG: NADPH:quinone reductase [Firmicutes bacterium]|nr:NADPH:quinone reductase [Alicyclobacillaceae bacterium]MCL6497428.1 NADPH:quinone reductase [Bacillota bacterium]
MRAIVVRALGGPEGMHLQEETLPPPGPGEVRVRLYAAGVNPVDRMTRLGAVGQAAVPYIPGSDGAGEVIAVGPGVTRVQVGDRVYVAGAPTYAEETNAPEAAVWPLPAHLSFEQGAAIGIPYLTAWRALTLSGAVPGDWVLVHGASGGVGMAAVQIGRAHGLRVVGTASTEAGRELVQAHGAEAALAHDDLEGLKAVTSGEGYPAILTMRGAQTLDLDLRLAKPLGTIVVIGATGPVTVQTPDLLGKTVSVRGYTNRQVTPEERVRIHHALAGLFQAGLARPVIGRRYPLEQAGEAQESLFREPATGKVVLTLA